MLQSVKSGTQSPGNLFTANRQGAIVQLGRLIERQAQRVFAQVSELNQPQEHPLRMFRPQRPMMHASWSIQAAAATYHESHVHSRVGSAARVIQTFHRCSRMTAPMVS